MTSLMWQKRTNITSYNISKFILKEFGNLSVISLIYSKKIVRCILECALKILKFSSHNVSSQFFPLLKICNI